MDSEPLVFQLWGISVCTAALVGLVWAFLIWRKGRP